MLRRTQAPRGPTQAYAAKHDRLEPTWPRGLGSTAVPLLLLRAVLLSALSPWFAPFLVGVSSLRDERAGE